MAEEKSTPSQRTGTAAPGRGMPHSVEAEEYLLSCCLIDGAEVMARCLEAAGHNLGAVNQAAREEILLGLDAVRHPPPRRRSAGSLRGGALLFGHSEGRP